MFILLSHFILSLAISKEDTLVVPKAIQPAIQ